MRVIDIELVLRHPMLTRLQPSARHVRLSNGFDLLHAVDLAFLVKIPEDLVQDEDNLLLSELDHLIEVDDIAEEDGDLVLLLGHELVPTFHLFADELRDEHREELSVLDCLRLQLRHGFVHYAVSLLFLIREDPHEHGDQ